MKLLHTLQQSGIRPSPSVLRRVEQLRHLLSLHQIPKELQQKLAMLPSSHALTRALSAVHQGLAAGRTDFDDVILYALAYVWEEFDEVPDDTTGGLLDDADVIVKASRSRSSAWGDLILKSRRQLIAASWRNAN